MRYQFKKDYGRPTQFVNIRPHIYRPEIFELEIRKFQFYTLLSSPKYVFLSASH